MKAGLRLIRTLSVFVVASIAFVASADADIPSEPPKTQADPMSELLRPVKASPTPLGEKSVLTVSASGAQLELVGLRRWGAVRERFLDPMTKPELEKIGLARLVLREPRKFWKMFDPTLPYSRSDYYWNCPYLMYGMPLPPYCQQDPIWCMPIGFNLGNWYW